MAHATEDTYKELEKIRKRNGGLLRPSDTVAYAMDDRTELHSHFEWDDTKAGHEHRLLQARKIISVHVVIEPTENKEFRAYVSLESDRQSPEGGYRTMKEVMSNDELKAELLGQAHTEALSWQRKYRHLQALAPIFNAIDKVCLQVKA